MTNLNKYKRKDLSVLDQKNDTIPSNQIIVQTFNQRKRREKKYIEKITINLTKEEFELLEKINKNSGVPKSTIIRQKLIESGLFR